MCGIIGALYFGRNTRPLSDDLVVGMRDTMRHRGPDDAGNWINPRRNLALAHRRLSIVDLSVDGRQPMSNETGTVWITFNGEIYNHADLRTELATRGHRFRSRSDTEVIVHLYEELDDGCVDRLDGMFAFGLWDESRSRLVLARDRLGVKPLYYTRQQGMLLFASEIKALVAHPLVSRDIDTEALYHYLTFRTVPAPMTMFAGIHKLPAGHVLTCDAEGQVTIRRYWDPVRPGEEPPKHDPAAPERVRDMLAASVRKRLVADVPTGIFLSGGLDSSAIVALAALHSGRPLNTFSIGIKDLEGYNELDYARLVANRFGANHTELLIGRQEVEDYFPELIHHLDEPLADSTCVPLYYLAREARRVGVYVVQVGEGSDEQFLGYDTRVDFLRDYKRTWGRVRRLPRPVVRALWQALRAANALTGAAGRQVRALGKLARRDELFWGSVAFRDVEKSQLLGAGFPTPRSTSQAILNDVARPLTDAWPAAEIAAHVSYVDIKMRLAELLLMRVDKVTMSVGVEAREPFMDYKLVEYLMTIPQTIKLNGWSAKHLLKRAMTNIVPAEIIARPKQAFAAPISAWMHAGLDAFIRRGILESKLRERGLFNYDYVNRILDEHSSRRGDHGVALWTFLNLSAWYDYWIAGSPPGAGAAGTAEPPSVALASATGGAQ
jgi:asparagine synthase (glutamine-hydrolysing)